MLDESFSVNGGKGKWAQLPYISERKNTHLGFIHLSKSQPKPMNCSRMEISLHLNE